MYVELSLLVLGFLIIGLRVPYIITYNWRSHVHILKKIINQQECMGKLSLGYIWMFGATIIILTTVLYKCTTNMLKRIQMIFRGKSPFL